MEKVKKTTLAGLKWLSLYTKTDMVYLARGGFWLGIGQTISSISVFILSIAFANILSPDTYGIYKYVLSINSLLLITTLSGIDNAVTQSIAKKIEGVLMPGMFTKMKWGVIGSALSLIVSTYYYIYGNTTLSVAFLITAIFIPFTESFDIYNSLLQGKKLFKTFTIFNSLTQILSVGSLIATLYFTHNILVLIFVYFLSNTLLNGLFLILSIKNYPPNTDTDPTSLVYGKKLSALYVVSLIASELDKLLVFHYLGAVTLALYTVAIAPTEQLKGILKNVQFLILPKIAENSHLDIKKSLFKKTFIYAGFICVCTVAYILICPFVFKLAFPKYTEAIFYSQLISISIVGAAISPIFYIYLETKRATKQVTQFHVWSNIINISFLFVGIYYFGLIGMIVSRILIRFTVLGLTVSLANKTS